MFSEGFFVLVAPQGGAFIGTKKPPKPDGLGGDSVSLSYCFHSVLTGDGQSRKTTGVEGPKTQILEN